MTRAPSEPQGYLPPAVRHLVSLDESQTRPSQPSLLLTTEGLIPVESIKQFLPAAPDSESLQSMSTDFDAFKGACLQTKIELISRGSNQDTLRSLFSGALEWMGTEQRSAEIWLDLYTRGHYDQAWLVGSTVLEQILGNIICSVQGPNALVPFLVRDLLAATCLVKTLEKDLIGIVKALLGSPQTLNLRNLLWHGFITPQDRTPLDAYGSMLIVATMTIATMAQEKGIQPLRSRHQAPTICYFRHPFWHSDLTDAPASCFDYAFEAVAYGHSETGASMEKTGRDQWLNYLASALEGSPFVVPGTLMQWQAACRHLAPGNTSTFLFVMTTLPLLEHGLRLAYVDVNSCKEDRRSALIAGEFYLTMDVILSDFVPADYFEADSGILLGASDPENIPNRLVPALGTHIMNALGDLFIHCNGPRLRDRTSHGELNMCLGHDVSVEPWFGYYFALVVTLLRGHGIYQCGKEDIGILSEDPILACIRHYGSSRFDEWSVLRKETARCLWLLGSYKDVSLISLDQDNGDKAAVWLEMLAQPSRALIFRDTAMLTSAPRDEILAHCLSKWSASPPMTLTFSLNLSAWILILQAIQVSVGKVTLKISTLTEQLAQRKLSSRSRKQFENMKPMMPRLLGMLVGCLAFIEHFVLSPSSGTPFAEDALIVTKASREEIQLRLKITTFVDKFGSFFEQLKLNMMEPAWQELVKSIEAIETEWK